MKLQILLEGFGPIHDSRNIELSDQGVAALLQLGLQCLEDSVEDAEALVPDLLRLNDKRKMSPIRSVVR